MRPGQSRRFCGVHTPRLFLLWEDIVEVRPKMILSFFATVMATAVAGGAQ